MGCSPWELSKEEKRRTCPRAQTGSGLSYVPSDCLLGWDRPGGAKRLGEEEAGLRGLQVSRVAGPRGPRHLLPLGTCAPAEPWAPLLPPAGREGGQAGILSGYKGPWVAAAALSVPRLRPRRSRPGSSALSSSGCTRPSRASAARAAAEDGGSGGRLWGGAGRCPGGRARTSQTTRGWPVPEALRPGLPAQVPPKSVGAPPLPPPPFLRAGQASPHAHAQGWGLPLRSRARGPALPRPPPHPSRSRLWSWKLAPSEGGLEVLSGNSVLWFPELLGWRLWPRDWTEKSGIHFSLPLSPPLESVVLRHWVRALAPSTPFLPFCSGGRQPRGTEGILWISVCWTPACVIAL